MEEGSSWSCCYSRSLMMGSGEETEKEKGVGVAWQLLSHFHRPASQPGQGWVEVVELSVLGAGLPQD